jgi:hypothetical protein
MHSRSPARRGIEWMREHYRRVGQAPRFCSTGQGTATARLARTRPVSHTLSPSQRLSWSARAPRSRAFLLPFGAPGDGPAAAWPLAASAQQGDRVQRIGVLMGGDENDPVRKTYVSAFTQALADLDWTDGRNVRMDLRWAAMTTIGYQRSHGITKEGRLDCGSSRLPRRLNRSGPMRPQE